MKKLLGLVAVVALFVAVAAPALAHYRRSSDELDVDNWAVVTNFTKTEAESGDNEVGGMMVWGGTYRTGTATAKADVRNDINYTEVGCGTCGLDEVEIDNHAMVFNNTRTEAESGDNEVGGKMVFGGHYRTGGANADSLVWNFVNTTVVGGVLAN